MGQVRFKIGIPGVGAAARAAEGQPSVAPLDLPKGGSAARAAEERNRAGRKSTGSADSPSARTIANISLRGQNGQVSQRLMPTSTPSSRSTAFHQAVHDLTGPHEPAADEMGKALPGAPHTNLSSHSVSSSVPATSAGDSSTVDLSPGPLQTTAVRFQTLLRSLFSSGDAAGKS